VYSYAHAAEVTVRAQSDVDHARVRGTMPLCFRIYCNFLVQNLRIHHSNMHRSEFTNSAVGANIRTLKYSQSHRHYIFQCIKYVVLLC
jgi:hypothetical protein